MPEVEGRQMATAPRSNRLSFKRGEGELGVRLNAVMPLILEVVARVGRCAAHGAVVWFARGPGGATSSRIGLPHSKNGAPTFLGSV